MAKNDFLTMIEAADTIAILGHTHPDGDCVGSTIGLYNYITDNYDKQVQVYLEEFSGDFLFLRGAEQVSHTVSDTVYDLCIVVDCGDADRPGDFRRIYDRAKHTMCVDHHISNPSFGEVCYVDTEACSAAEALYKLMEQDKIGKYTAEALYMGIVHDTGVFRHSNTTKLSMHIAGDLIEKGANPAYIIDETFYKKTFVQNRLLGIALTGMEQFANGRITSVILRTEDFEAAGAGLIDTDGIVDQLRITDGTETALFMYQTAQDTFKISLRSNNIVDVSKIACSHGGGGHVRAAGFTVKGDAESLRREIVREIEEQLHAV